MAVDRMTASTRDTAAENAERKRVMIDETKRTKCNQGISKKHRDKLQV